MHEPSSGRASEVPVWHFFVPKLIVVLREGYDLAMLRRDAVAGLTVAIVALPLAMALAIASGTTPDKGLVTAVVAGFLISALGGSRFQIGGPTGAFVVVVFGVIAEHGFDGLVLATLMAGIMLTLFGLFRLGTVIKFIPYPVVTGFTAGIAVIIATSQVDDFLGLEGGSAEVVEAWRGYLAGLGNTDPATVAVAGGSLAAILLLRRFAPKVPAFLVAVVGGSLAVWALDLQVATIGSEFGGIPRDLPSPGLPDLDLAKVRAVLPAAFTIALLAGIESLLSAMVADGLTGRRHKSNCELMAQGVANIASALVGGLPATGAVARTVTNVKAGGVSPFAGILHAVFLLAIIWGLAPLAVWVPLGSLAAVLMVVAWNMGEIDRFKTLNLAPRGDRLVLLTTFALTVLVDLTLAIEVGVVLAALLFMKRMADITAVEREEAIPGLEEDEDDMAADRAAGEAAYAPLPPGVEVFQIRGPFFFGVATRFREVLGRTQDRPKVVVLRMRLVPAVDATGAHALASLVRATHLAGGEVILSGVRADLRETIEDALEAEHAGGVHFTGRTPEAIELARRIAGLDPTAASG